MPYIEEAEFSDTVWSKLIVLKTGGPLIFKIEELR